MPIYTEWYVPERVIVAHVIGDITKDDMDIHMADMQRLLDAGKAPIHWINNTTDMTKSYSDLNTARSTFNYMRHPSLGWAVVFGQKAGTFSRFFSSMLAQIFGVKLRNFETYEEALAFLKEMDSSVDFVGLEPPTYKPEKSAKS